MKQAADLYTADMLEAPKRGRPRKANALTPAERARRYRARQGSQPRPEIASFLAECGVSTVDDLADLTMDEARAIIIKARARWFTGPQA